MVIRRTNSKAAPAANVTPFEATADACFRSMKRKAVSATSRRIPITTVTPMETAVPVRTAPATPGDIIYGAKAIAGFIFGDDGNRSRRRVFNLWNHYRDRNARAGFFKLKGALCLSKSQWQDFHGLG